MIRDKLISQGLKIWLDEDNILLGDSLRRSIDIGLSKSRFGIVILSPDYIRKQWTNRELSGLLARENSGSKVILPVWHRVKPEDVLEFSPMLSDRLAISTDMGIEKVCSEIIKATSIKTIEKQNPKNEIFKNIFSFNQILNREIYLKYISTFFIFTFLTGAISRLTYVKNTAPSEFIDGIQSPYKEIYTIYALLVLYMAICVIANRLRDMGHRGVFVFLYIGIWYVSYSALTDMLNVEDPSTIFEDSICTFIGYILLLPLAASRQYKSR